MVNQDTNHWTTWPGEKLSALANEIHALLQTPEGWSSLFFCLPTRWEVPTIVSFFVRLRRPMPNYPTRKQGIFLNIPVESAVHLVSLNTNAAKALMATNVQAAINSAIQVPPGAHYPSFIFREDLNATNY